MLGDFSEEQLESCLDGWFTAPGSGEVDLAAYVRHCAQTFKCDEEKLLEEVRRRTGYSMAGSASEKLQRVREFCERLREDDGTRSFVLQYEMRRVADKVLAIMEGDDE